MEWVKGIQKAINYIEDHITEPIDYTQVAKESFSSAYHFQRVFSILSGYTLGEYIRNRRLSLAGAELAASKEKVIDIAAKYGYESPDSFAKAFQKFHGITPSQARSEGAKLRNFSRLSLKISLEGGNFMDYKIVEMEEMLLTGYKRRFCGTPEKRDRQDERLAVSTRLYQCVLQGLARDCDTLYEVITNVDDQGYDFYLASRLDPVMMGYFEEYLGDFAKEYEHIRIPAGTYLVCETIRCQYPTLEREELRRKAVSEWLPSSGYELAQAPEFDIIHWFYQYADETVNASRYIELWLPITKRKS